MTLLGRPLRKDRHRADEGASARAWDEAMTRLLVSVAENPGAPLGMAPTRIPLFDELPSLHEIGVQHAGKRVLEEVVARRPRTPEQGVKTRPGWDYPHRYGRDA